VADPDRKRTHTRQREFIRHPARVPIELTRLRRKAESRIENVSYGGLSFVSDQPQEPGVELRLHIPLVDADFEARARVVWCEPDDGGYRVGVRFLDAHDAFRARMIQQLCAIESYRQQVLEREGRDLTGEQAAREWIERFGDHFPNP